MRAHVEERSEIVEAVLPSPGHTEEQVHLHGWVARRWPASQSGRLAFGCFPSQHVIPTFEGEKRVRSADFASGISCTPTVAAWHLHDGAMRFALGPQADERAAPLNRPCWLAGSQQAPADKA